jgi:hypothetical protein
MYQRPLLFSSNSLADKFTHLKCEEMENHGFKSKNIVAPELYLRTMSFTFNISVVSIFALYYVSVSEFVFIA